MNKKIIAPIVIGVLVCTYLSLYLIGVFLMGGAFDNMAILTLVFSVIIIAFIFVMIYVVKQRIDEINGGEEDDISKY